MIPTLLLSSIIQSVYQLLPRRNLTIRDASAMELGNNPCCTKILCKIFLKNQCINFFAHILVPISIVRVFIYSKMIMRNGSFCYMAVVAINGVTNIQPVGAATTTMAIFIFLPLLAILGVVKCHQRTCR